MFEATIDVYSYTHLEQTDEKALIDRKDARFIKAFLRKHNFSSDGENTWQKKEPMNSLLLLSATDVLTAKTIRQSTTACLHRKMQLCLRSS